MPPLRDRRDDIPALVEHFLVKYRFTPGAIPTTISEEALARLIEHDWPGNVRELENAIERAVVLSRGNPITTEHLAFTEPPVATNGSGTPRTLAARRTKLDADASELAGRREKLERDESDAAADKAQRAKNGGGSFKDQVSALERQLIAEALERAGGNRTQAAKELGIYRRLLYDKIKEYGLD
jgi:DNA-binding NtrC family response regulator